MGVWGVGGWGNGQTSRTDEMGRRVKNSKAQVKKRVKNAYEHTLLDRAGGSDEAVGRRRHHRSRCRNKAETADI